MNLPFYEYLDVFESIQETSKTIVAKLLYLIDWKVYLLLPRMIAKNAAQWVKEEIFILNSSFGPYCEDLSALELDEMEGRIDYLRNFYADQRKALKMI